MTKPTKIQGKGHRPYLSPRDVARDQPQPTLQTYPQRTALAVRPGPAKRGKPRT